MESALYNYLHGDTVNEHEHLLTLLHAQSVGLLATRINAYHTPLVEGYILNDEVRAEDLVAFFSSDPQGSIIAAELLSQLIENFHAEVAPNDHRRYEIPLIKDFSLSEVSFAGQTKIKKLIEWIESSMQPGSAVVSERVGFDFMRISNDNVLNMAKPLDFLSQYYSPTAALSKALRVISALGKPEQSPKLNFYLCVTLFKQYLEQRNDSGPDVFLDFAERMSIVRDSSISQLPSQSLLQYRDVYALLATAEMSLSENEQQFFAPWYVAIAEALCRYLEKPTPAKLHFLQFKSGFIHDIPVLVGCLSKTVNDPALTKQFSTVLMANAIKSDNHLKESSAIELSTLIDAMEHLVDWPNVLKMSGRKAENTLVKYFGFRDSFGQYLSSNGRRQALDSDLGL